MSLSTRGRVLFLALFCVATVLVLRAGVRAAAPAGHYTVNGATVTDNKTKLVWQQTPAPTVMTWADAKSYCAGAAVSAALGGTGWRLPTVKELQSLVDYSVASGGPTIDSTYFPNTPATYYWSTSLINTSDVACVDFTDAKTYGYSSGGGNTAEVRCVR